jgi:hypothetical protein
VLQPRVAQRSVVIGPVTDGAASGGEKRAGDACHPGQRSCTTQDVACSDPLVQQRDVSGTGDITLQVPWPFSGYIELRSDLTVTMLYYLTQPLTTPTELASLQLITSWSH